ncbi:Crp/Fnr family transcriptional regulator [Puia dinghuensis]|uniref:cAMP-binding protein n=1 Tax=Puia dinghuensis TaxID=1792502 RepID=A0A8J2UGZ2_9BACT|nr:Crp/Fnr family transcriptional regulator [Puia dinghuensis]GGB15591.1 cAMP-binding protein [Puia dinghuensis]
MYDRVTEYIRRRVVVSDEALGRAFLFSREVRFAKGEVILRAGEYCSFIGFLNSGLIMVTLHDDLGKEVICNFCFENEFFTYVESINDNIPSHKNFVALEDCSVLLLNKSQLPDVFAIHPAFETLFNRVILEDLHRMMLYAQEKQMQSAEERYVKMMVTHPELLERVPLKFIAGYLGVAAPSLSRMRKRLAGK